MLLLLKLYLDFCFGDQKFLIIHLLIHFSSAVFDTKQSINAVSTATNG
jgi:hypothetical protein